MNQDICNDIKSMNIIHTTWKDYALLLLNSTSDPLRSIWREKIVTSVAHWEFGDGSISEGNVAGIEVLASLPSSFTEMVVDDHFEKDSWEKRGRLNGSKRMKVFLGNYPQESISNEANLCIKYILNNWDEWNHLIWENELLKSIWDFAQKSGGKCVLPDEVCTYILEKPVDDSKYGVWIDVSEDVFTNGIPSDEYKDYWKSKKIEGYPFARFDNESKEWVSTEEDKRVLTLEEQKKNFSAICDVVLKEDVSMSPCWKKICICILKNDVKMGYAGFSATLRERQAREQAVAAFSTKQEEKEKAKIAAEQLAKKIENERLKKEK